MLLGPDADARALRPPDAAELTGAEWSALRRALASAVSAWRGAGLMGMAPGGAELLAGPGQVFLAEGSVAWQTEGGEATLVLPATLAAGLVCVTLGGEPQPGDGRLSPIDLAVLDVWAREALGKLAALSGIATGAARRVEGDAAGALEQVQWPAVVALVTTPAGDATVVMPAGAIRRVSAGGPRLGDDPRALLEVRVRAEARLHGTEVPLTDLVAAAEGDVLLMGEAARQVVGIYVAGSQVASGRAGVKSGRLAVRIERIENLTRR